MQKSERLGTDDGGHDRHDRRTTLLAIHLYHVIYTVLCTGTQ